MGNIQRIQRCGDVDIFFARNTNKVIENAFCDKPETFEKASIRLSGIPFQDNSSHDMSICFNVLPRIPVLLRFIFEDDDFSALCSVLFRESAQYFFDMESLAIAGTFLAGMLARNMAL